MSEYNDIDINNNVNVNDLKHNFKFIHGHSKENINITIFIITIGGKQLKYTIEAINKLTTNFNILVHIIMNISPTNKAYNMMRENCKTKYFVQLDEDMELFYNATEIFYNTIKTKKTYFLFKYLLKDKYLGMGKYETIQCLKMYNNHIMQKYTTYNNGDVSVSSVDRLWHEPIVKDGYQDKHTNTIIGYHALHRTPFDLMIRYSKTTKSFLNKNIKMNSGDICRFLRPINKIKDFSELFDCLYSHFCLIYDKKTIDTNYQKILKSTSVFVHPNILASYNIPEKSRKLDKSPTFSFDNYMYIMKRTVGDIYDIYALIGILYTLSGKYEYSFDKYPYELYNYFNKLLGINLVMVYKNKEIRKQTEEMLELYENINIMPIVNIPSRQILNSILNNITIPIDNIITIEQLDNNKIKIILTRENTKIIFKSEEEFKNYILNTKRREKLSYNNNKQMINIQTVGDEVFELKNNIIYINKKKYFGYRMKSFEGENKDMIEHLISIV